MVKGRQGFALEVWKFGVYLMIPVGASIYWNNTDRQKQNADYWQVCYVASGRRFYSIVFISFPSFSNCLPM